MITGFGVAESIFHYYNIWGGMLRVKVIRDEMLALQQHIICQKKGKDVGIIDKECGEINEDGFSFDQIKSFFLNKNKNKFVSDNSESFEEINSKIWDIKSDIFIPCAASRIVTKDQVDRMINSGLELISMVQMCLCR